MSTRYGLRIGDIGVEFPSREERQKALLAFTAGVDVGIKDRGHKYIPGTGNFSVYERDSKEDVVICTVCKGDFLTESCTEREYPIKYSYSKNFTTDTNYICDACYAKQMKAKELFDAKALVASQEN